MTVMELGALGEFLGAIGVIATLIYLSVQVRQNTRAMKENKRLALAQTCQIHADALQSMLEEPVSTKRLRAWWPKDKRRSEISRRY